MTKKVSKNFTRDRTFKIGFYANETQHCFEVMVETPAELYQPRYFERAGALKSTNNDVPKLGKSKRWDVRKEYCVWFVDSVVTSGVRHEYVGRKQKRVPCASDDQLWTNLRDEQPCNRDGQWIERI